MNTDYMLACGVVRRRTADPEAGWDLVDGLKGIQKSASLRKPSSLRAGKARWVC